MITKEALTKIILQNFDHEGYSAYIVGGAVRDILRGVEPNDYDICVSATPEQIIEVANKYNIRYVPTGISHGTISFIIDNNEFQITTFRIDHNQDGRHAEVQWTSSLYEDLMRRDFTINAMSLDINYNLFDPFNGITDIDHKLIRTVGEPILRFNEDKLRALRAIRFATTLNFRIYENTWKAINQTDISNISKERVRDELIKILESPNRVSGFKMLDESGLLNQIIPEFEAMKGLTAGENVHHPEKDVFIHTIAALSHLSRRNIKRPISLELILATMLHDIGKPESWENYHFKGHEEIGAKIAKEILLRLKFPTEIIDKVVWFIANHMLLHKFDELRTAKKVRLIQHTQFNDLLDLLRADIMINEDKYIIGEICTFRNTYVPPKVPTKLINGYDLMALGIKPGPHMAKILIEVENRIIEGMIKNREEALDSVKYSLMMQE